MLKVSQLHGFNAGATRYPIVTYDGGGGGADALAGGFGQPNLDLSAAKMDCFILAVAFGTNNNANFNVVTLNGVAPDGSVTAYDTNNTDHAGCGIFWWLNPPLINPCPLSLTTTDQFAGFIFKNLGLSGVNQTTPTVVTTSSTTSGLAAKSIGLNTATGGNARKTTIIGARALAKSVLNATQTPGTGVTEVVTVNHIDNATIFVGKSEGVFPGTFNFGTTASATPQGDAMVGVAFRS